jgi:hypothetical protein
VSAPGHHALCWCDDCKVYEPPPAWVDPWETRLNAALLTEATRVGNARQDRAERMGFKNLAGGVIMGDRKAHIQGASAEAAFHSISGLSWDKGLEGKRPDVGGYFIRSTLNHDGYLIVRCAGPGEPPRTNGDESGIYILGVGRGRSWRFVGWASVPAVLRVGWYGDKSGLGLRPCWWVKQSALSSMDTLPRGTT